MTDVSLSAVAATERQLSLDNLAPAASDGRHTPPCDSPRAGLDPLLTPQQILEHCGIGYHTLLREFRSGRLPALKLAGHWRVEPAAYRDWPDRQRYVPRSKLELRAAPPRPLASRSTDVAGSLVRLRAIEEQESR